MRKSRRRRRMRRRRRKTPPPPPGLSQASSSGLARGRPPSLLGARAVAWSRRGALCQGSSRTPGSCYVDRRQPRQRRSILNAAGDPE
eukprot:4710476-Pyramimonas_sp.AAC.1